MISTAVATPLAWTLQLLNKTTQVIQAIVDITNRALLLPIHRRSRGKYGTAKDAW
jgi:hypothetical protein